MLVDARGVPLAIVAAGANVHDSKLLRPTLEGVVVAPPGNREEHLCADAAYKGRENMRTVVELGYIPHIKQRKEEAEEISRVPGAKARRWVVERTHSWLKRWRKLLVSFEKTRLSYEALRKLAVGLIGWRQTIVIYG